MLRVLVLFGLLGLTLADGYGHKTQTCVPRLFTTTITNSRVSTAYLTITEYDQRKLVTNIDITKHDVRTVPATNYITVFVTAAPILSTVTSFITQPLYKSSEVLLYNTVFVTQTKEVVLTEVETKTQHVTQTGIAITTVTLHKTIETKQTALLDRDITTTVSKFVTSTIFKKVLLTKTSYLRNPVVQRNTHTVFVTKPVEFTTTTTQRQYVTSCYLPKVTYDH
ncbi:uncharacterized protein [Palaemon carinicauda]|uniref:uncharacterized protein n=1 Tax=Palaemon carinicauda TaxID=392227 RepID=UPI0035B67634